MKTINQFALVISAKQAQLAAVNALLDAEYARNEAVGITRRELNLVVRGLRISRAKVKHGHAFAGRPSAEYKVWNAIRNRCGNQSNAAFMDYGGRGIYVCEEWSSSFTQFLSDMGPRPENHTLDRIDNDGPYAPWNCRWATRKQQARNRRSSRNLTWNGQSKTIAEWADDIGISAQTLVSRLNTGWSVARTLTTPAGPYKGRGKQ